MSAPKPPQIEESDIKDHVESLFKKTLRKEVRALIKQLPAEINDQNEMEISISKGIEKLIVMMEAGTEFHPSLNPPDYVNTNQATYSIDYEKLKTLLAASAPIPKIEGPSKEIGPTE